MNQNWKWKIYLVLFTALISIYALIPTLAGFGKLREEAEKKAQPLPWYVKIFPEKVLNLGLDLRGGIYLELEVSVEQAIQNRLDLMAGEISRQLKSDGIENVTLERVPKAYRLRALVPDENAQKKLLSIVRDYYRGALVEQRETGELIFESSEKEESQLQTIYSQLSSLIGQQGIVEVERFKQNHYVFILQDGADVSAATDLIKSKVPNLQVYQETGKIIFKITDTYLAKLRSDTVKQAVETIRNRIDRYGVSEPSIRQLGDNRIAVELPGVTDPDRAISIVKKSGKLEFKIVDESMKDDAVRSLVATLQKENTIPEGYTEEIVGRINEAAKGKIPADTEIAFEVQYDPVSKKIVGGMPYLLKRKAEVTGEMLRGAQVNVTNNEPSVSLSFNNIGTKAFGDLTAANVGKRLAILLDGSVTKAPVLKSAIPSGEAQITLGYGSYDSLMREAEDLSLVLREGALPASLKEITKTVIGPSLGEEAIHQSLLAALLAGLTVILFMIIYYKASGLIADVALGLNVLLIMGMLALFQATLTLPGIAGIVLTMGMALDASIIIFERIREELKTGKAVKAAVEAGFSNAWTAVLDTHLTTFLSGMVLYQFGTGPIRGFAVTLMIGVVTTLFTAYWVSKLMFEYLTIEVKIKKLSI